MGILTNMTETPSLDSIIDRAIEAFAKATHDSLLYAIVQDNGKAAMKTFLYTTLRAVAREAAFSALLDFPPRDEVHEDGDKVHQVLSKMKLL